MTTGYRPGHLFALSFALVLLLALHGEARAEKLTVPRDTTAIEDYAFANCASFTGPLVIPEGVISIGAHAFDGCTVLTGVPVIPSTMNRIYDGAFANCTGMSDTLRLAENVRLIGDPFTGSNLTVYRGDELVYEPAVGE